MESGCSPLKVEKAKEQIIANGKKVAKPIVINNKKILLDGYSRYLAAKSLGLTTIPCEQHEQFIYGTFEGNPKPYVWANRNHIPIKKGDLVIVENREGEFATVKVKKIFMAKLHDNFPLRKTILRKATDEI